MMSSRPDGIAKPTEVTSLDGAVNVVSRGREEADGGHVPGRPRARHLRVRQHLRRSGNGTD